ncbi:MAG: DNA polymerase III subunit gamma/tau [Oscillospiraceae bacterium]|jgi:DNA polymerase-3 subunit gamma/tau|nr:DNA polymerase III subunit gamma/tau [Oscillospiraceae bacterium]
MPKIQALYRIWRSRRFGEVVGQDAIVRILRGQVEHNRAAHAYLFSGPRGVGKTSLAKIFAKAINCERPEHGEPCGACASCIAVAEESSLDVLELDAASNNRVDDARALIESVKYPPASLKYKVYIIDEAHMLTTQAFNALLKTLEEPPPYAIFILATTEPRKLPDTILSRCQWHAFRRITAQVITDRLRLVCESGGILYEEEALATIAQYADGGMRDALSVLDVVSSSASASDENGTVTSKLVCETLGTADPYARAKIGGLLVRRDITGALEEAHRMLRAGLEPQELADGIAQHIRAVIFRKAGVQEEFAREARLQAELDAQAALLSTAELLAILDLFAAASNVNKWNANPRLTLERAILRACVGAEPVPTVSAAPKLPRSVEQPSAAPIIEKKTVAVPKAVAATASDVFEKAVNTAKSKAPRIYGFMREGTAQKIENGTIEVYFGEGTNLQFDVMSREANIKLAEDCLAQAGFPLKFVPTNSKRQERRSEEIKHGGDSYMKTIYEAFGRGNVELVGE